MHRKRCAPASRICMLCHIHINPEHINQCAQHQHRLPRRCSSGCRASCWAVLPLARSSGSSSSINMFHSGSLPVQLAVATRLVPPGQHSAAATDPVPVRRGSGPPMPVCDGLMSESFDPAAQSPSSASKLSANGCVALGAGRRHVCLN